MVRSRGHSGAAETVHRLRKDRGGSGRACAAPANSGAYSGRVGTVSVTGQGTTALGKYLAPPRRVRLGDVSPQVLIFAVGIAALFLF